MKEYDKKEWENDKQLTNIMAQGSQQQAQLLIRREQGLDIRLLHDHPHSMHDRKGMVEGVERVGQVAFRDLADEGGHHLGCFDHGQDRWVRQQQHLAIEDELVDGPGEDVQVPCTQSLGVGVALNQGLVRPEALDVVPPGYVALLHHLGDLLVVASLLRGGLLLGHVHSQHGLLGRALQVIIALPKATAHADQHVLGLHHYSNLGTEE